jgi:hypothetical protein
MYRVPPTGRWWPAVVAPVDRGVMPRLLEGEWLCAGLKPCKHWTDGEVDCTTALLGFAVVLCGLKQQQVHLDDI